MNTNQTGCAGVRPGSEMVLTGPTPLDDAGQLEEIADKVKGGRALVEVIFFPWGVEFYVRDVVKTQ